MKATFLLPLEMAHGEHAAAVEEAVRIAKALGVAGCKFQSNGWAFTVYNNGTAHRTKDGVLEAYNNRSRMFERGVGEGN